MMLTLLSAISFSAFAADEPSMKISVSSAEVKAGDSVSVDITIDKNPGVFGFTSEVDYDADSFTFDKADVQGIFGKEEVMISEVEAGKLTISAIDSGMENKTGTGKFVTLTFKTTKNSVNGEHKIKIKEYNDTSKKISGEAIQSIDKDPYNKVIPVEYNGGTITLSGGSDKKVETTTSSDGGIQPWIIVVAVAAVLVVLVVLLFVSQSKKGKKKQGNNADNGKDGGLSQNANGGQSIGQSEVKNDIQPEAQTETKSEVKTED